MKALEVKNLNKTYKDNFVALKNINLTLEQGDFLGLLGVNGAGKSTLLNIISSLLTPTCGSVEILGKNLFNNPREAKRYMGVVPQEINLPGFEKVFDIVIYQAGFYGLWGKEIKKRTQYLLENLNLWEKRDKKVISLSGGMKRRLMIACALIHKPKLLLLDEPTTGVDIEIRRKMWTFISELNNEKNVSIILTTHYLEEAQKFCDTIAVIKDGTIIENMNTNDLISKMPFRNLYFTLLEPIKNLPKFELTDIKSSKLIDKHTFKLTVSKNLNMTKLFNNFNKHNIAIKDYKNEHNELEELFFYINKQN